MSVQPDRQTLSLEWGPDIRVDLPQILQEGAVPVPVSFSETSEERIVRVASGIINGHLKELERLANRISLLNHEVDFAHALGQAARSYEDPPDASDLRITNNYPDYHET